MFMDLIICLVIAQQQRLDAAAALLAHRTTSITPACSPLAQRSLQATASVPKGAG